MEVEFRKRKENNLRKLVKLDPSDDFVSQEYIEVFIEEADNNVLNPNSATVLTEEMFENIVMKEDLSRINKISSAESSVEVQSSGNIQLHSDGQSSMNIGSDINALSYRGARLNMDTSLLLQSDDNVGLLISDNLYLKNFDGQYQVATTNEIGHLDTLKTENKLNLVDAVNEVNSKVDNMEFGVKENIEGSNVKIVGSDSMYISGAGMSSIYMSSDISFTNGYGTTLRVDGEDVDIIRGGKGPFPVVTTDEMGCAENLQTTNKSNLVSAINEINAIAISKVNTMKKKESTNSIYFGDNALENVPYNDNIAIGDNALRGVPFEGEPAAYMSTTIAIGTNALSNVSEGYESVVIGTGALAQAEYSSTSVSIGHRVMPYVRYVDYNTVIGSRALESVNESAYNSTVVGSSALNRLEEGYANTAIGSDAGYNLYNAEKSLFLGAFTSSLESSSNNEIVIGTLARGGGSNTITLGNSDITKLRCQVTAITALSDSRVKEDVQRADLELCYKAVKELPVSRYKYKDFTGKHIDKNVTGWMADDVERIFPKSVSKTNQYFPVLDEHGNKAYEEVEERVIEIIDGLEVEKVRIRKVEKMFMLEDVKDITMTEALPTLWGAVQQLMKKVEDLEYKLVRRSDGFDR